MAYYDDGLAALAEVDARLRQLMSHALKAGEFGDLRRLAGLADGVSALLATPETSHGAVARLASASSDNSVSNPVGRSPRVSGRVGRRRPEFPKFERDGDRLVKIGWSKRDRASYEHRTPRAVAERLFAVLPTVASRRGVKKFGSESVLPLHEADGSEVPSYQAYLALAWLRACGVVEKAGKNRYGVDADALANTHFEQLWSTLKTHGEPET